MIKLTHETLPDGRIVVRGADGDRSFTAAVRIRSDGPRRWTVDHVKNVGGRITEKFTSQHDSPGKVTDHLAGLMAWALTSAVMDAVTAVSRGEVARLGLKL